MATHNSHIRHTFDWPRDILHGGNKPAFVGTFPEAEIVRSDVMQLSGISFIICGSQSRPHRRHRQHMPRLKVADRTLEQ